MGRSVTFPSNGTECAGYLAEADGASAGIVVVQEWWGLVPHIKDVCERFAREGFTAVAPDLFHGKTTTEPDEAMKLMMALQLERAAKDMAGAVGFLKEEVGMSKIGSVGFCMGGALSLTLGTIAPVDAVVAFYGLPTEQQPEWSNLAGPVQGHFAERDNFFSPAAAKELFEKLDGIGKQTELHVYDGTDHGFFNDDNPGVHDHDAAELAWGRTLDFFRKHLS